MKKLLIGLIIFGFIGIAHADTMQQLQNRKRLYQKKIQEMSQQIQIYQDAIKGINKQLKELGEKDGK